MFIALFPAVSRCQGGYTWTVVSPPATGNHLRGVCSIAEDDVWAVGDSGTILHYDGSNWSTVSSPTSNSLRSISPAWKDDIWAVGVSGTIIRYSGAGGWNAVSPSPTTELLNSVSTLGSGEAWAVGILGGIFHFNGSGWSEVLPKPTDRGLYGVAAVSSGDVWAVGEGHAYPTIEHATVFHYGGTMWSQYPSTAYGFMLDISAAAPNDIWACGYDGMTTALLFHYDGSGWTKYPVSGCSELWGIHARASNDVWAVGDGGKVMHFDGSTWADVSGATEKTLLDVVSPCPGVVWAVGADGVILRGRSAVPTIDAISRSTGPVGAEITLHGDHFGTVRSSSKVRFNGTAAADSDHTYWSDNQIRVEVPKSTSSGPVTVTTDFGTSNGVGFRVTPTIASISPSADTQGTTVSITGLAGTGFRGTPAVKLKRTGQADIIATDVKLVSPEKITCKLAIPANAAVGAWNLYVENPDGQSATKTGAFTIKSLSSTWYLAEGSTTWGYDCYITIQNPNSTDTTADVTYMIEGGTPVTKTKTVKANSRATFNIADDIGEKDASIKVEGNIPVIPERAMYRNGRREGHDSIGTTSPASDFYLAEGTSAYGFTTYVLIQNPNPEATDVTVTYMTGAGPQPQAPFSMEPNSRKTIRVNDVPGMGNIDFSTQVHGTKPIIAERAMYWDNGTGEACHDSVGMASAHSSFYLPDGQTSEGRETYTLVQNPNSTDVTVEISYMTPDGEGNVVFTETIGANSRMTYNMVDKGISGRAAVMVTSKTTGKKIMVERAMYWNGRGAGTDTIGGYSD